MAFNWIRDQVVTDSRCECLNGHDHRNYRDATECNERHEVKCSHGHTHKNAKDAEKCEDEKRFQVKCFMGHLHKDYKESLACEKETGAGVFTFNYTNTKTNQTFEGMLDRCKRKGLIKTNMDQPEDKPVVVGFLQEASNQNDSWKRMGETNAMQVQYHD